MEIVFIIVAFLLGGLVVWLILNTLLKSRTSNIIKEAEAEAKAKEQAEAEAKAKAEAERLANPTTEDLLKEIIVLLKKD